MKKRGFTLIELLAVIVILAIIALIATPIVMNVIENSRKGATERSAENYIDAVETAVATERINNKVLEGTYKIQGDGSICPKAGCGENDADKVKIDMSGNKPSNGTIKITNGLVTTESTMIIGDYTVSYDETKKAYVSTTVNLCTANTSKVNANVWDQKNDPGNILSYTPEEVGLLASTDGSYTPGVTYTCNFIDDSEENNMTFFVLSSTNDKVTLISGSNLETTVAWSEDGSNHKDDPEEQAVTAKTALATRTSTWLKANGGKLTAKEQATIKLPTKVQIEGAYEGTMPEWLYTHTTDNVAFGYWTSSPDADDSSLAWRVTSSGGVSTNYVVNDRSGGVRPVITISKSKL